MLPLREQTQQQHLAERTNNFATLARVWKILEIIHGIGKHAPRSAGSQSRAYLAVSMWTGTLRVKLFQDGAELDAMIAAKNRGRVSGFTTNPTLMRKAGISDYEAFGRKAIAAIPDLPISFEVFSDDFETNVVQADACGCHIIAATPDIIAKIPLLDKSLRQYSLETVKMFYNDARAAGFKIV